MGFDSLNPQLYLPTNLTHTRETSLSGLPPSSDLCFIHKTQPSDLWAVGCGLVGRTWTWLRRDVLEEVASNASPSTKSTPGFGGRTGLTLESEL